MVSMTWFWRLVCEPECSEACQVNCPGCRELAGEWASQGHVTPAATAPPVRFQLRKLPELWNCWSKSVSARMIARLNPFRRRGEAPVPVGCGCQAEAQAQAQAPAQAPAPAQARVTADPGAVIKNEVRKHYSAQAQTIAAQLSGDCCSPALPLEISATPMYSAGDLSEVPAEALLASLGCGNPLARADLRPGEVVLDLGSGGGMDVVAAATRVSPDGMVYGLDSSDEMLAMARGNAAKAGAGNVLFLKGDLEAVPLPPESVDVIISNCVVNLAPDKDLALSEAFRVLRPGGRLAISDIVTKEPVPPPLKESLVAWAACIGGALSEDEYRERLTGAGFTQIEISRDREYTAEDAAAAGLSDLLARAGLDTALRLGFASAGVCAKKGAEGARADSVPAGVQAGMAAATSCATGCCGGDC
jgi:arsenite methyltransferase